ncbi:MAG TPA: redoxin family protein [Dongiaceae bacterium]|nr:redoxin family protein [Dongiaceae bacterium]
MNENRQCRRARESTDSPRLPPFVHCTVVCLLLFITCAAAQGGEERHDSAQDEVKAGTLLLQQGNFPEAKAHFERAQALHGKPTAETTAGIGLAELQMGNFEAARQMFTLELQYVTNDHARAQAHYMIGSAWFREARDNDRHKLEAAEKSFREAVKFDPRYDLAYFNLGYVMLRQNKEEDSNQAFRDFIRAAAENPESERDLPLTPKTSAPKFNVVDSAGKPLSSDSLRGRFVLLDFWATWCPPCIRALPAMRQLSHFFPGSKFLLVSVNEDDDRDVWRRFNDLQHMDWTQVGDENAALYHAFGLTPPGSNLSLPRYVLIDREGFVRQIYSGTDQLGMVVGQVVRLVRNAEAR